MQARVLAINISEKKGTIKHSVSESITIDEFGIQGDAHAGAWHRQISLLDQTSVQKMLDRGAQGLVPGVFAENITTQGLDLYQLPIGAKFKINDVLLELTQIGKECHHHCQIYQQVGMCVMPTDGVFARVLHGGTIRAGDEIKVILPVRAIVITMSDKGAAGLREDKSGPALVQALSGKAEIVRTLLLADDQKKLEEALIAIADKNQADLVLTTGGTGFSPRDFTPEATLAVIERSTPGICEAMRAASLKITPHAMLSRAQAGIRKRTLIVNLPGSPKAALECLQVILPALPHALETLSGEAYECATPKKD
ncbi:MAG: molybdopterin-binding protein [Anaerolineaceae bacterium]|nr:molybdopterin-binding protein [Anaerolineaceae bacterium]